jgi:integrase
MATTTKAGARKIRLTKSTVKALPVPSDQLAVYWDKELSGFGVRVSPEGRKTYFLQCRTRVGRSVKLTLGRADRITGEQARDAAGKHLAAIELGRDPAAELKAARKAERERREAPTIDLLWERFQAGYLAGKRPKTQSAYESWYRLHIKPRIGRTKVADLTDQRVERLHEEISAATGPSTANRAHAVLSSMLTYAVKPLRLVTVNVAKGAVVRHKEHHRERTLSDAELKALIDALAASEAVEARLLEFLLATGARTGEVLAMRWSDIDGVWWTIPAAISKTGKAVKRPLNEAALAVVAKVERKGALVFEGVTESRLQKWWQRERGKIGLADVHKHDLRHAAASLALNAGIPLAAVGTLLGHGVDSAAMTKRYAHLHDKALAEASAAVSDRLKLLREAPVAGSA